MCTTLTTSCVTSDTAGQDQRNVPEEPQLTDTDMVADSSMPPKDEPTNSPEPEPEPEPAHSTSTVAVATTTDTSPSTTTVLTTTTTVSTATTPEDMSTPTLPTTPDTLPGTAYAYGPSAGDPLTVVGVAHDDVLNVRDVPNGKIIARLRNRVSGEIDIATLVLQPVNDEVIAIIDLVGGVKATGHTRQLITTVWYEVDIGPITGWASSAYLAPLGSPRNANDRLIAELGEMPQAATLTDLVINVSKALVPDNTHTTYRRTIVFAPEIGEGVGGATIDVLGFSYDALLGHRISIAADPAPEIDWWQVPTEDAGPFTLWNVTLTHICNSSGVEGCW